MFSTRQASSVMGDDADGDDNEGASSANAGSDGGLADIAESIVDAVENATAEIFNATQVITFLIYRSKQFVDQQSVTSFSFILF